MNKGKIVTLSKQSNRALVALGSVFALTVLMSFGCTEEDTPTGATKDIGSLSDSSFQLVSNQFSADGIGIDGLDWIDILVRELPGPPLASSEMGIKENVRPFFRRTGGQPPLPDDTLVSVSFVIDEVSGWITFNAVITNTRDTFTVVDSMRFRDRTNTPVIPYPPLNADSLNGLDIRIHGSATIADPNEFTGTAAIHASTTADIIGRDPQTSDTIRINSTETDSLNGLAIDTTNGHCQFNVTSTTVLTDIIGLMDDTTSACPLSGNARVTADISADCTAGIGSGTLTFNETWTFSVTFNDGVDATFVFENSTTRWETTELCGDNPPAAVNSLHRLANVARAAIE